MPEGIQDLILAQLEKLSEKVEGCTVGVAKLTERVDGHAAAQSREHAEVQRRVGALELKTNALGETTASTKVKVGFFGVALGAIVSEAMRRLFHG